MRRITRTASWRGKAQCKHPRRFAAATLEETKWEPCSTRPLRRIPTWAWLTGNSTTATPTQRARATSTAQMQAIRAEMTQPLAVHHGAKLSETRELILLLGSRPAGEKPSPAGFRFCASRWGLSLIGWLAPCHTPLSSCHNCRVDVSFSFAWFSSSISQDR
jgi:hypothetical protein